MLIAQSAFPHYVDTDGSPITGGSLYYGTVGANPRTSPVAIYWDAAGTQPAPQPVRTLAGYPVRNGSPANVYINGAYSVALYNAGGGLVFYAPDSAAFDAVLSATSPFMRGLLDDADDEAARTTLGAASLGANTFTGAQTLAGNAANPLEAVPLQQAQALVSGLASALSFSGLALSASGASANISLSATEILLRASDGSAELVSGASLTINSAGAGANGLDTGTIAASTWYSVWVISDGTTTAGLLSLSTTTPAMPIGYTHKALVGFIRTDATANKFPLGFVQFGRYAQYRVAASSNVTSLPLAASGAVGTYGSAWGAVALRGQAIPPIATAVVLVHASTNTSSTGMSFAPNPWYGFTTNGGAIFWTPGTSTVSYALRMTLESDSIYCSNQSNTQVAVLGWELNI